MIRVGTYTIDRRGIKIYPNYNGFTKIIIDYGSVYENLAPWKLKNSNNKYIENLIQFSKVYKEVPEITQLKSKKNPELIWKHAREIHISNNKIMDKYYKWSEKGKNNIKAVSYPVGKKKMDMFEYALIKYRDGTYSSPLNHIALRKRIIIPLYAHTVRKNKLFKKLQEKIYIGENLLIICRNGPLQKMMVYYKRRYPNKTLLIENNTILITKDTINILLHDMKYIFGFGYCLAMALLGVDEIWNNNITYEDYLKYRNINKLQNYRLVKGKNPKDLLEEMVICNNYKDIKN